MYYNYHAKAKNLIKKGDLIDFKHVKAYKNISPCLILFFKSHAPMPIRAERFLEYYELIDKYFDKNHNRDMEYEIKCVVGTLIKTNNYIITYGDNALLIDASASLFKIDELLIGKTLQGVLLTHGHWDHFETLDHICEKYNCKCYCLYEAYLKMKNNKAKLPLNKNIETTLPENKFVFIKDGEVINLANLEVKVMKTLGHTSCSVCYIIGDDLFSGDTLFKNGVGRTDLPTGDQNELERSIKKIFSLNNNYRVYPGHGETTTINAEITNY